MSRPVFARFAASQFVYTPALSVEHDSICDTRLRAFDFASESWPFFCWPRKAGRAIAARMPMIRITTRSSMSVKPFSSPLIRWESFRSMFTPPWSLWSGQTPRQPPRWWQLGRLQRGEPPRGSPGALRPRLATGLPLHRGPDSYWGHLSTPKTGFLRGLSSRRGVRGAAYHRSRALPPRDPAVRSHPRARGACRGGVADAGGAGSGARSAQRRSTHGAGDPRARVLGRRQARAPRTRGR